MAVTRPTLAAAGLLGSNEGLGPGVGVMETDFTSSWSLPRNAEVNSQAPQRVNCCTSYLKLAGNVKTLAGKTGKQAHNLRARHGDGHQKVYHNDIINMAFSKMHGDANCDQTVNPDFVHVVNAGCNQNEKCVHFCPSESLHVIPWVGEPPAWFIMPDGFSFRERIPFTPDQITRLFHLHDGCGAQRDCLHAFYGVQTFHKRTGVKLDFVQHPASKGKCMCDGHSTGVRSTTATAARRGENCPSTTLGYVVQSCRRAASTPLARVTRRGTALRRSTGCITSPQTPPAVASAPPRTRSLLAITPWKPSPKNARAALTRPDLKLHGGVYTLSSKGHDAILEAAVQG